MNYQRASTAIFLTLLFATAGSAQTRITPSRPKIGTDRAKTLRPEPCWEEAGIPKSVIEQRRQIERITRGEIQSVCNDSSLTPEQKREKIRQLHQQARQQMQGLITPQQKEAMKACQQQRAAAHPPNSGLGKHVGGRGPCGEMASNANPLLANRSRAVPSLPTRPTGSPHHESGYYIHHDQYSQDH
jgi:hypothetical protein